MGYDNHEISIVITDDDHMRELNSSYRGIDNTTNVLSFSMIEGDFQDMGANLLGDLVISLPTAQKEAIESGITLEERLSQLLVHGILHLVGYDHETGEDQERKMVEKSLELLKLIEPESELDYF
ncbi:putative metal-dependent hydrolase (fragment) [Desulfamplus magnetovallimortis]|uniref:Endoribonuclease YbeY n=1 Tax=Desulfamplus magnetovallimortis TaxID=1246637 RepID=A0A1W1H9A9_9BACT